MHPLTGLNKAQCRGIMVIGEWREGRFESVTYELIGKAWEMADKTGQEVTCVVVGHNIKAEDLLFYPVDRVLLYDSPMFQYFVAGTFAAAIEDAVLVEQPSVVLIGATPVGRSLAPRVAVRFRTGLTADCTVLDIRPNGELVQTRPAFGGNIMATIVTREARPQMATVRPKVMPRAEAARHPRNGCTLRSMAVSSEHALTELASHLARTRVMLDRPLPKSVSISDAKVIVACGRGLRSRDDLDMFDELAQRLGGVLAVSRPLVEQGWMAPDRQVGQSGRTVRPDLYIACGISGAIQHIAGISSSTTVVAINNDSGAPILEAANYGLVGDMYRIVPALLSLMGVDSTKVVSYGGV